MQGAKSDCTLHGTVIYQSDGLWKQTLPREHCVSRHSFRLQRGEQPFLGAGRVFSYPQGLVEATLGVEVPQTGQLTPSDVPGSANSPPHRPVVQAAKLLVRRLSIVPL